jgi:hypothetical protein
MLQRKAGGIWLPTGASAEKSKESEARVLITWNLTVFNRLLVVLIATQLNEVNNGYKM